MRERFNNNVDYMIQKSQNTLLTKAKEYQSSDNPYVNFEIGAGILGLTPAQVLLGYTTKHIASVVEMVNHDRLDEIDKLEEKAQDIINYLLILVAMAKEQQYQQSKDPVADYADMDYQNLLMQVANLEDTLKQLTREVDNLSYKITGQE